MKLGASWNLKEIPPEARETAEQAAGRSGMSLSDWLNAVITQQAELDRVQSPPLAGRDSHGGDFATMRQRFDELAQHVEQLARTGPAAYAPKRSRNEPDPLREQMARVDRRPDELAGGPPPELPNVLLPPSLDRAVAEISARKRMLNGSAAPPHEQQPQAVMAEAAPPAQNLSGLEDLLRDITRQIETLRNPGLEQSINALREELGEIGRALGNAMPRQAIESIERQIHNLDRRIAEGRQAGVDAAALSGIERGLAEVRNELHGLMPAENLIGFTDAVENLAHKVDQIVAQKDPMTMAQLESAIITLRGMSNHVASNDTVRGLAAQVHALGEKVDAMAVASAGPGAGGDVFNYLDHRIAALSDALSERAQGDASVLSRLEALVESLAGKIEQIQNAGGGGDVLNHLDHRIAALSDALTERAQVDASESHRLEALVESLASKIEQIQHASGGGDVLNYLDHRITALSDALSERAQGDASVSHQLEALVEALAGKIEQIQHAGGDGGAFGHLEDRIVRLAEKLDASDSRLGHLEGIEHGLADLLIYFEKMRENAAAAELHAQDSPEVGDLKHDIARTQDALEAVHGTLGHVVDRLAIIENDIRGETRPHGAPDAIATPRQPADPVAQAPAAPMHAPLPPAALAPPLAPAPAPRRMPQAQLPVEHDMPADEPLEPGSGPPALTANPAARIAASEAALGGASPAAGGGKSSFIAAARRAAQAAMQQPNSRAARAEPVESQERAAGSLRTKMMKRVKSLFVAASIIAIVIGSIQIAGNVLDFGSSTTKTAQAPVAKIDKSDVAVEDKAPDSTASIPTNPLPLPAPPAMGQTPAAI